jgi:hypothetical protein
VLVDLDELVLRVRDPESRRNIDEAVRVLRAGSPRAAILLVWLAVVFDVVGKLRELEEGGDAKAKAYREEFEDIRARADVKRAQEFEGRIPAIALELELISRLEQQDLERLHQDRHRCAHPSQVDEGVPFAPSHELARSHLRHAIEVLLQHPPAQGKAALARIQADVDSPYFAQQLPAAIKWVRESALARGRVSLVRNFAIAIVKSILEAAQLKEEHARRRLALAASWEVRPADLDPLVRERFVSLCAAVDDPRLKNILFLGRLAPRIWSALPSTLSDRLLRYVETPPAHDARYVTTLAAPFKEFERIVVARIVGFGADDYTWTMTTMGSQVPPHIADALIDRWLARAEMPFGSKNVLETSITRLVPLGHYMTAEQIRRLFKALVDENQQPRARGDAPLSLLVCNLDEPTAYREFLASPAAPHFSWNDLQIPF